MNYKLDLKTPDYEAEVFFTTTDVNSKKLKKIITIWLNGLVGQMADEILIARRVELLRELELSIKFDMGRDVNIVRKDEKMTIVITNICIIPV